MSDFINEFQLELFDQFTDSFKALNKLVAEILLALDNFLNILNTYFELFEAQFRTENKDSVNVSLYKLCMIKNNTYICTKDNHYSAPAFDNVAIKMSEDENEMYIMDNGYCFGKVCKFLF